MAVQKVSSQISTVWIPSSIQEAVSLKNRLAPDAAYVSGATLLQLKWQAGVEMPKHHISLEKIPDLRQLNVDKGHLEIGAGTTLSTLRNHSVIRTVHPIISEAAKTIAAPAVRNRGTVGGNVMWGEGDLIPLLLTMEAQLTFFAKNGFQTVEMADWLNSSDFRDALLVKVAIPERDSSTQSFYRKIGRRETFTAAIVTIAGQVRFSNKDGFTEVRLAIGGGSNKPLRLVKIEQYLLGKSVEKIHWPTVYQWILKEFHPSSDAFVSSEYKKKVAANLIISELRRLLFLQEEACV